MLSRKIYGVGRVAIATVTAQSHTVSSKKSNERWAFLHELDISSPWRTLFELTSN
jgi:hypothetical protein